MERVTYFVDVLLPLPLPSLFTYRVPNEFEHTLQFGMRVVVPFGRSKLYSGLIVDVHTKVPKRIQVKYILELIDEQPIISPKQFQLWQWIAEYYMCHLGEVMAAALPSALKLASETKIMLNPAFNGDVSTLTENELKLAETLSYRTLMTVDEISKAIGIAKIIPLIKSLIDKEIIITDEEIKNPYKPKIETYIALSPDIANNEKSFFSLIDTLASSKRTEKQSDLLLSFLLLQKKSGANLQNFSIKRSDFLKQAEVSVARLETMLEKGIFVKKEVVVSRLTEFKALENPSTIVLSPPQQEAKQEIEQQFMTKEVVLLHGITGSGKTEIYIKFIQQAIEEGKQVLYLLPEIALTTQIVNRLRKYFGDKIGVYHSRFNEYERVEIWNRVLNQNKEGKLSQNKYQVILGARSALLLPYQNLGLIIVDEEHDGSYKQIDPAPRYHARDAAIVLAKIHQAKTLLGTATPSLETYYNTKSGKYGIVELFQRYAEGQLPEIWTVDIREALKQKKMRGNFTQFLIENIQEALSKKEQIILFQNRRGYSLHLFCHSCQHIPSCEYCDVTLTYHKKLNLLKCHYCGYAIDVPKSCPICKSHHVEMKGFGTEKLEEELQALFPSVTVARMDLDTTRSKRSHQQLITDFENRKIDILVGTQMVTKGFDFSHVSVVGVLNADQLISYPDFRSFERAFQILAQVSGRAGRKNSEGKVIIQSYQPKHPALQYVIKNDYEAMYQQQIAERKQFHYPPIYRLIKITLKDKDDEKLDKAAAALAPILKEAFPSHILGPEYPIVSKIQNYYLKDFWLKLPRNSNLAFQKQKLQNIISQFQTQSSFKSIRVVINVDS
ncbi:MAG TPA: primosomal protein N' [Bacteroidales bacterium]|nr:primosomal protein N' [Bacteroidales bacterium]